MNSPQTEMQQVVEGFDWSVANSKIDFARVKAAGILFHVGRANEGERKCDTLFSSRIAQGRDQGLLGTAYHFAYPDDDPRDDVAAFVECTRPAELDLPIWLDVETLNGRSKMQVDEFLTGWLAEYFAISGATRADIYTGRYFWENVFGDYGRATKWADRCGLVSAAYGAASPPRFDPWVKARYHQYAGNTIWLMPDGSNKWGVKKPLGAVRMLARGGLVDGVDGECDRDRFFGTYDDLLRYAGKPALAPEAPSRRRENAESSSPYPDEEPITTVERMKTMQEKNSC